MYKEFMPESEVLAGHLVGGSKEEHWTNLWQRVGFHTQSQIKSLDMTPQWREIEKLVTSGEKILEAGCGVGSWVRFFSLQGLDPVGLDFSEKVICSLRKHFPEHEWIRSDIRDIPLKTDHFDALVSWGVIEHLEEGPQQALKEFYRVIRPGGHIFLTVPWLSPYRLNHGYELNGSNQQTFSETKVAEFYQYYMTEEEMRKFCEQAGFSVLKIVPSSIHAKSLLSLKFRKSHPMATKIFNRIFSNLLPEKLIASMVLLVGRKPA